MPNLATNMAAMGSYPGSKDEVDHELSHERFVDRLEQVYGKEGLDKRMGVVSDRLENRPEILDKVGMARINPFHMFGQVPTMWSRRMPYKFMGESLTYGRPEMWGKNLSGAYIHGGNSLIPGIPTAYIHSESSKKPESFFTTTPPAQTSWGPGVATFGRPTKELPRGAYMPQETSVATHELAHHSYTDSPEAIEMKGTEAEKEAFGGILSDGLVRGGLPAYEVPVYLSEIIHWYANRNLDPEKLANDPEYRLNAQRDIPVTEEDHAKAWDAFGEMLETVPPEGWGAAKWNRNKWEKINKERNKVLRILPEVVQQDNLQENMIG